MIGNPDNRMMRCYILPAAATGEPRRFREKGFLILAIRFGLYRIKMETQYNAVHDNAVHGKALCFITWENKRRQKELHYIPAFMRYCV